MPREDKDWETNADCHYNIPCLVVSSALKPFIMWLTFLEGCCLNHPVNYATDQIKIVEVWCKSENAGPSGGGIFLLADGRWGALEESQNYTGHGCQCCSNVVFYDTREEAIRLGLTPDLAGRLGLKKEN